MQSDPDPDLVFDLNLPKDRPVSDAFTNEELTALWRAYVRSRPEMIARLHEELAAYEGSEAARQPEST